MKVWISLQLQRNHPYNSLWLTVTHTVPEGPTVINYLISQVNKV